MRTLAMLGLTAWLAVCTSAEATLVYTDVVADERAIRYLLDANDAGDLVGSVPSTPPGSLDGFIRSADGTTAFWSTPERLAYPTAINNAGKVVGTNIPTASGLPEGFQRNAAGIETPYNFDGALGTVPFGISNDDTVSGFYITPSGRRGFIEQPSTGLSRSVEFPGAVETQLYGLNDVGQAGGAYYDSTGAAIPFIYDIALDRFEAIAAPTEGNYVVTSINDAGDAIVFGLRDATENYADLRSFIRDGATGEMTELFHPDAVETYGYDVDASGRIIGYYLAEDGSYRGFRAVAVSEPAALLAVLLGFAAIVATRSNAAQRLVAAKNACRTDSLASRCGDIVPGSPSKPSPIAAVVCRVAAGRHIR